MPIVASLTITIDEKGNVTTNAPFGQLVLCYGLLECAKDACRSENHKLLNPIERALPSDILDLAARQFGAKQ